MNVPTSLAAGLVLAAAAASHAQPGSCTSPFTLFAGSTLSSSNVNSIADGNSTCSATSANTRNVWFRYTHNEFQSQVLVLSLCGSDFDTALSLHSGCPGTAANQIACNDDFCDVQSQIQHQVNPGDVVLIRVGGFLGATGNFALSASLQDMAPPPVIGPDVTASNLIDITNFGAVGNVTAYAVGTDACNVGDIPAEWVAGTNQHPVIAQNMYRLKAGRFEQIGQSWLKHAFASTNVSVCATCVQPPNGAAQLGVGCSDAYGSGLNGAQDLLGPRSQVNASTGDFPFPFTAPAAQAIIGRRLQVFTSDVTPALNPSSQYFVEAQYVTLDDALSGNGRNNATYRQVAIASQTATPTFVGAAFTQDPAIQAWKRADPSVTLVPVDYLDQDIQARFWVGAKVTNNGNGTWTYEYAIQNLNSTSSGGSFAVRIPGGATVTNTGFHAPFSHSGEPFSNAPWTLTRESTSITFACEPFEVNPNANAIRWGTLYNVRFTSNDDPAPPATGAATLGLFLPGDPLFPGLPVLLPVVGLPVPSAKCPVDWDLSGRVDPADISRFIADWFASIGPRSAPADFDRNGTVDPADIARFVTDWFAAVTTGGC